MTDTATPTISAIIPAYIPKGDRAGSVLADLVRCVRGLIASSPPQFCELLVQDDASPGIDTLDGVLPGLVGYERNPTNLGFAGNCNAAARRARGRYLLFINQDILALGNWYAPLLETFNRGIEAGQQVGLAGPKLLFPHEQSPDFTTTGLLTLQSCGGIYDQVCQPTHRYLGYREDYPEANRYQEVSWITGAVHCWRREAFEAIGGYDVAYQGGYFEDVDACCRAQSAGWRVWYCPAARFLHKVATSGGVKAEQFAANARRFRQTWVDTGKVSRDVNVRCESWW